MRGDMKANNFKRTIRNKTIFYYFNLLLILIFSILAVLAVTGCSTKSKHVIIEQYEYYKNGKLKAKIAPDGSRTKYEYNGQGLPIKIVYPGGRVLYGYDENGNRIWMKDQTGTTEYYYDAFDRLVGAIWKHGPWKLIVYSYDPWSYLNYMAIFNLNMMEQKIRYKDILRDIKIKPAERVKRWKERELRFQQILEQLRLENAEIKQRCTEYEVRYHHDIPGNLTGIDTKWGRIKYFYYPDKGQIERLLPNGITTRFTYSPDGLLKSLHHESSTGKLILEYQYDYNAASKVISVHELTLEESQTTKYIWDTRGYLKELHFSDGNRIRFEYDVMGNRILKQDTKGTLRYDYDKLGRLIQAGNLRYKWDKNGNLISQIEKQSKTRIRYDGRGLPSLIRIPDATIRYAWDGDGNMISRRQGKEITHYLPNPLAPTGFTLAECDKTGKLTASYLYGDALLGQQDMNGQMRYFLEDGFNSIRHIADINGEIMGQQDYTPFGEPILMKGNITAKFRMAGERFLPEINSYAIGGRLYEPQSGRYLAPDSLTGYMERFDSFNKYAHGCNVSEIFMEPRCNQTAKNKGWTYWVPEVAKFALEKLQGKLEEAGMYGLPFDFGGIGDLAELAGRQLGGQPISRYDLLKAFEKTLGDFGILEAHLSRFMERRWDSPYHVWQKGWWRGPEQGIKSWSPEDAEEFGRAALRLLGRKWGVGVSEALDLIGQGVANLAGFYGTRSIRPYWWWSPMKWIPQEQYLPRYLEEREALGRELNDPLKSVESQLGGIELASTGEFIGNLGGITGAVFDTKKQCLVLVGDKNLSVPSIKVEDLAVALESVFGPAAQDPQFSLDPADPRNPKGKWLKAVYIPKKIIGGTSFGMAMFEADWLLKQYSFGIKIDENGELQERKSSVPGFKSTADLSLEEHGHEYGEERWARFWIVSDDMKLKKYGNSIYFDLAKMRVKAKKQVPDPSSPTGLRDVDTEDDPIATKFANLFTKLYNELAKKSPEFERVRELAKAVALAKWLKKEGIPIDMDWVFKHANKRIETTEKIPALSVSWQKQEQKPYSKGRLTGIQAITHQLHFFGGIDLTVNPKYVSDDGTAGSLQEAVRSKLREKDVGPVFTVKHNGNSLQAIVLPITSSGQEMWNNLTSIEIDGILYQFNNQREIIRSIDRDGNTTKYEYDPNHKLTTVRISNGNGWKVIGERSLAGSLLTVTNRRGNTFKYKYSTSGYLNEFEVDGRKWATYEFNQERREVIIRYDGYIENINYDGSGRMRMYEIHTEKGSATSEPETVRAYFEYNKSGNLTKVGGIGLHSISISYAEDGINPTKIATPLAQIRYSYDSEGRIKEITHSYGISASYVYDGKKFTKLHVDYRGKKAEYWFNEDGIVKSMDLLGEIADYTYTNGNLSSVKLAKYATANYIYDDQNRLREIRFPDGGWIEYRYEEGKAREKRVNDYKRQTLIVITHPVSTYKR